MGLNSARSGTFETEATPTDAPPTVSDTNGVEQHTSFFGDARAIGAFRAPVDYRDRSIRTPSLRRGAVIRRQGRDAAGRDPSGVE